jgi:hypothetical protein
MIAKNPLSPLITPASSHVKGCHAGLDPASTPVLDSRFRGNDGFDIYCCQSNNPFNIKPFRLSSLYRQGKPERRSLSRTITIHPKPATVHFNQATSEA